MDCLEGECDREHGTNSADNLGGLTLKIMRRLLYFLVLIVTFKVLCLCTVSSNHPHINTSRLGNG